MIMELHTYKNAQLNCCLTSFHLEMGCRMLIKKMYQNTEFIEKSVTSYNTSDYRHYESIRICIN